ncbi:peptidoglycan biosynthesis protein MviN/MurJ (putative lipid II flippase) [Thermoflavifilum aggregans]|uniref:Peptidoglycan biosynthesis protein MviN/MurJ (Putative lipid II flippase) n=1 Tax=Thermoflavifilum aggregans TaxID=454188 RepID=A0A2M9CUW9_9BACT|nr:lipid II flippase MurJ [Thermoflavifilum aggregans]PJJ75645.1 peptidoglycan biosynthesis protein MviN/MurJ (putative lipid II flippase) [Thermoflavifilum aggregans]
MEIRTESYKKGLAVSTIFNVASKAIAFLSNLVIAYYFGATFHTDIYFYIITIFNLISYFITSVTTSVIIPESMRIREEDNDLCIHFLNKFFFLFTSIGVVFSLIFCLFPVSLFSVISKYSVNVLLENKLTLILGSALFPIIIATNFLNDVLISYKIFTAPMIVTAINSLFIIIFIIFLHSVLNTQSLIIGYASGYVFNIGVLFFLLKAQLHWKFSLLSSLRIRVQGKLWHDILYSQSGSIVSILSSYFPIYLLSSFDGGIVSAVNYAQKIAYIPHYVISSQFAVVVGVKFNELFARKEYADLNQTYRRAVEFILFTIIPFSLFLFFFRNEITVFLFNRGHATSQDVIHISRLLGYFSLPVCLIAVNNIFAYLCFSAQIVKYSFLFQIATNILSLLSIYPFIKMFGYIGYPLNVLFVFLITLILFPMVFSRLLSHINLKIIYWYLIKIVFVNILLIGGTYYVVHLLNLNTFFTLCIGFISSVLLLLLFNHLFKINQDISFLIYHLNRYLKFPFRYLLKN